jgi:hypothetical protein
MISINYWTVLVAAIVNMLLGWLWYGPLFGKAWTSMMHFTQADMDAARKKGMGKSYALMFIASLVMSWVLAHAVIFASAYLFASLAWYGAFAGIAVGFLSWLGFVAPVTVSSVIWEGKSWKLWWLGSGYYLVGLCLMGAILATWM